MSSFTQETLRFAVAGAGKSSYVGEVVKADGMSEA